MRCPNCGKNCNDTFKFCPDCGAPLRAELGPGASGGVAQGEGAVAAGTGGVAVGGDVHGDVYIGQPPRDEAEALLIYRRVLAHVYIDLDTTARVPLAKKKRDLAASLPDPLPRRAEPCCLWDFIAARLAAMNLKLAAAPLARNAGPLEEIGKFAHVWRDYEKRESVFRYAGF